MKDIFILQIRKIKKKRTKFRSLFVYQNLVLKMQYYQEKQFQLIHLNSIHTVNRICGAFQLNSELETLDLIVKDSKTNKALGFLGTLNTSGLKLMCITT